ncbi:MAG: hypothetical protein JW816_04730 [Candidatus Buchananbacteria bacterium]|nr:hypothetical protein [Candidatus Buchananbacteria bacterium]
MAESTTTPTPNKKNQSSAVKWQIATIVLAIILVLVLAFLIPQVASGNKIEVVKPQEAGTNLVEFINKIYGTQLDGTATLGDVSEENGIYKIGLTITGSQQPDQTVYLTKDGKMFIPQIIDIDDVLTQYNNYQAQQAQQPVDDAINTAPEDTNTATQ